MHTRSKRRIFPPQQQKPRCIQECYNRCAKILQGTRGTEGKSAGMYEEKKMCDIRLWILTHIANMLHINDTDGNDINQVDAKLTEQCF